jgi:hypothetical protein
MAKKYVVKKFDGDDSYSYAIFLAKDVKGLGSIVFYGEARPVVCGLNRTTAQFDCKKLNNK